VTCTRRQFSLGERVRLRADAMRTRIRPAGSLGTIYEISSDDRNIVFVKWDEPGYYGHKDDDIVVDQLEEVA